MDFEELLGALFVLYILGSMVSGFLRRGRQPRRTSEGDQGGADKGRPGFPQVLDMEELERRLRDLAAGRPPGQRDESVPSTKTTAAEVLEPALPDSAPPAPPVAQSTPAEGRKSRPVTVRVPAVVPAADRDLWGADEDWEDVRDSSWPGTKPLPTKTSTPPAEALPPAVVAHMEQGNPWQAAFIIKEVLGPPRALNRHRGRPRF